MNISAVGTARRLKRLDEFVEVTGDALTTSYESVGIEIPDMEVVITRKWGPVTGANVNVENFLQLHVSASTPVDLLYEVVSHEALHNMRMNTGVFEYKTVGSRILEEGLAAHFGYSQAIANGSTDTSSLPNCVHGVRDATKDVVRMLGNRYNRNINDLMKIHNNTVPYNIGYSALTILRDPLLPIDRGLFLAEQDEIFERLGEAIGANMQDRAFQEGRDLQ